ncbi:MAG: hypothetical protein ACUVTH_13875 [Thermogutta sp.]
MAFTHFGLHAVGAHRRLTPAAQNTGASWSLARECEVFFARLHSPPAYAGGSERRRLRTLPAGKGEESTNLKPETNFVNNSACGYWAKTTNPQPSLLSALTSQLKTREKLQSPVSAGWLLAHLRRLSKKVTYLFHWPAAQIALLL